MSEGSLLNKQSVTQEEMDPALEELRLVAMNFPALTIILMGKENCSQESEDLYREMVIPLFEKFSQHRLG